MKTIGKWILAVLAVPALIACNKDEAVEDGGSQDGTNYNYTDIKMVSEDGNYVTANGKVIDLPAESSTLDISIYSATITSLTVTQTCEGITVEVLKDSADYDPQEAEDGEGVASTYYLQTIRITATENTGDVRNMGFKIIAETAGIAGSVPSRADMSVRQEGK